MFVYLDDGSEKCSAAGEKKGITKEEADVTEEEKTEESPFYDKSRSFFDRISCESLEKQEGFVDELCFLFLKFAVYPISSVFICQEASKIRLA